MFEELRRRRLKKYQQGTHATLSIAVDQLGTDVRVNCSKRSGTPESVRIR